VRKLSKHVDIGDFASLAPEFLNFLSEAALGAKCPKGIFLIYRAFDSFLDVPLVFMDPKPALAGKKTTLLFRCANIYGEACSKVPTVQGQLSLNGKTIGNTIKFNLDKKTNAFQGEFDTSFLTELRLYDLSISLTNSSLNYNVYHNIFLGGFKLIKFIFRL